MSKGKRARSGGKKPRPENYFARFGMGGFDNMEEIAGDFRDLDKHSYERGREDKAGARGFMSLAAFAAGDEYDELTNLPAPFKASIARANYAAYLDGYNGRDFRGPVIIEEG